jgi:transcriptional regulator with XRE-family HTH domain
MPWESFRMDHEDVRLKRGYVRFGRLVLRRRERLGLSQRQVENLSGIDQTVISRLENGQLRGLRFSRLARLVDALGGIGESDPVPAWATRYAPPARTVDEIQTSTQVDDGT